MRKSEKRFLKPIVVWLIFLPLGICLLNPTGAISKAISPESGNQYGLHREIDRLKILFVLENKMGNKKLLEKAMVKLTTLDEWQMQLITSLSDRIAHEGNTTGADIAFLLMTVLIIFS